MASSMAAESRTGVRLALLANLWDARRSYPPAERLVRQAASGDPAPEVREAAAKMLERQAD